MRLTCREAIARMSAFLGRELGPVDVARLVLHLCTCAPCRAYLRTLRATIRIAGRAADACSSWEWEAARPMPRMP